MTQNSINVTASTGAPIKVNVTASSSQGAVTSSQDTSAYNAEIARQWAISDKKVLQEDYSSKYYANKAKDSENSAKNYADATQETYNNVVDYSVEAMDNIEVTKNSAISDISETGHKAVTDIETEKQNTITEIQDITINNKEEIEKLSNQEQNKIVSLGIDTRANVDLSNLSATGEKHFLNKSQITNCIKEVPQRIKYTLEGGTLTIKAGSQVIVPNGFEKDGVTPKFEYFTLETDRRENTDFGYDSKHVLCYMPSTSAFFNPQIEICFSGNTKPTIGQYMLWYDTTNNKIKWSGDYGANWTSDPISFPILTGYLSGTTVWTSVNEVFNGFGYIGNTIWYDKDVTTLIPNGRNEDGTLRNIEYTFDALQLLDISDWNALNNTESGYVRAMRWKNTFQVGFQPYSRFYSITDTPSNIATGNYAYDENTNQWYWWDSNYVTGWTPVDIVILAEMTTKGGVFKQKQTFRAVDYNEALLTGDKQEIISWGMPDYTRGAALPADTLFQADQNYLLTVVSNTNSMTNYVYVGKTSNSLVEIGYNTGNVATSSITTVPVPKGWYYKVTGSGVNKYVVYPLIGG